ncbi:ScbR family autoregulator-binding transcription factor [Streptomyces sp. cmx-4-9]|uniref:ScbR family autoregulator-binding transcription factor n=1 Tax=Streptomyces sp. cmx-4-9 TaxID=2790941 RepID=UPI00397F2EC2
MSQREQQSARTRRLIVETAGGVFAEKGFNGAIIADVYSKLGLTRGAFYHHFKSKEELAKVVLEAQLSDMYPIIPRAVKLQELVDTGVLFAHRICNDPMVQGSIRLSLETGLDEQSRIRLFEAWDENNRGLLAAAAERGELHPDTDVADVARLFVGTFTGVQLVSELLEGRSDLQRRVEFLFQHVLAAITVPRILAKLDMSPGRADRVLLELRETGLLPG